MRFEYLDERIELVLESEEEEEFLKKLSDMIREPGELVELRLMKPGVVPEHVSEVGRFDVALFETDAERLTRGRQIPGRLAWRWRQRLRETEKPSDPQQLLPKPSLSLSKIRLRDLPVLLEPDEGDPVDLVELSECVRELALGDSGVGLASHDGGSCQTIPAAATEAQG